MKNKLFIQHVIKIKDKYEVLLLVTTNEKTI